MLADLTLRRHPVEVERWRRPMRRYWKALHPGRAWFGVDYMLFLMWHESRGDPAAVNMTYSDPGQQASGLMQHKPVYWDYRIDSVFLDLEPHGIREAWMDDKDGWPPDIFDPRANIAAAVWLYGEQGWAAWSPSQTFPPEEYEIPKPGKGVWWVDELGGYRCLGKGQ